jgi:hypothetical protein
MGWTLRNIFRYGLVLVAGLFAGGRIISAYLGWRQWQLLRPQDPSGADASLTFAEVDLVVAALWLALAGLVWWLLRPRSVTRESDQ